MNDTSGKASAAASRLGLHAGDLVGEMGYDDDVDAAFRAGIEEIIEAEILDSDDGDGADDVLDAVLVWWRAGDGDLTDDLVDAITLLADDGVVWLATPRAGSAGYVDPGEVGDAARTAGLARSTSGPSVGDWMVTKLVRSRASAKSRR